MKHCLPAIAHCSSDTLLLPATACSVLSGKSVGWYDAQGQGVKNDFCRFVFAGRNTWFACALAGTAPLSCSVTKSGVFSLNPIDSTMVLYTMTLQKVLSKGDTCANGACTGLTSDGCGMHCGVLLPVVGCVGWDVLMMLLPVVHVPAGISAGTAASPSNDATTTCYCLWCMRLLGSPQAPPPPPLMMLLPATACGACACWDLRRHLRLLL